jgi:hypothetical protein
MNKIEFKYNENGAINWRAMVKPEYLYPNKEWFEARNQKVPDSIEGLADNQLLIKLGGIKELAKLRGYQQVEYDIVKCERDYVVVKCRIDWNKLVIDEKLIENYCNFEDMANATLENTNDFCAKFLETIATNRAFVRCVRNYLGINIVGDDEIDKSKNRSISYENLEQPIMDISPQGILKKVAKEKAKCEDFDDFKNLLRKLWTEDKYKNEQTKNWSNFESIPAKECRTLISILK